MLTLLASTDRRVLLPATAPMAAVFLCMSRLRVLAKIASVPQREYLDVMLRGFVFRPRIPPARELYLFEQARPITRPLRSFSAVSPVVLPLPRVPNRRSFALVTLC